MKDYYNTNRETGQELANSRAKAGAQQKEVLEFFRKNPNTNWATFEIRQILMPESPHTSAQRCISNLTGIGLLEKTKFMVKSPYGKQVHTWRLAIGNKKPTQIGLF